MADPASTTPPSPRKKPSDTNVLASFDDDLSSLLLTAEDVLGGGGDFYGVRLSSPHKAFDQSARPTLHALATIYVVEGVKLLEVVDDVQTHTPLTMRETECLRWVSEGKSDWDIAEILGISESTVHAHVENAKRKIGVRSRVQATVLATVRGWLGVNPPSQRGR